jgi:predicted ArsR family transcriptional regulator
MANTLRTVPCHQVMRMRRAVASLESRKPLQRPILAALAEGGPVTDRQIAMKIDAPLTSVRSQLQVMCGKGFAQVHPQNRRHPAFQITSLGEIQLSRYQMFGRPERAVTEPAQIAV